MSKRQLSNLASVLESGKAKARERAACAIEYVATVPEFYDAINDYVAADLALLDGPLRFLVRNRRLLSLPNKLAWFRRRLASPSSAWALSTPGTWLTPVIVPRGPAGAAAATDQLLALPASGLRQCSQMFRAGFVGEEGVGTGPLRELLCDVGLAMMRAAFEASPAAPDVFHPAAGGWTGPAATQRVRTAEALGRLVGLALRRECQVGDA